MSITVRTISLTQDRDNMEIKGLKFKMTCSACPEQYDVFLPSGKQVGYVRLRHGGLKVSCPDYGGDQVYTYSWYDDGWKGCFDSEEERQEHLEKIAEAIWEWVGKKLEGENNEQ